MLISALMDQWFQSVSAQEGNVTLRRALIINFFGLKTSCEQNIDILSPYKVVMANL